MCNINIVLRKDGTNDKRIVDFINIISHVSFVYNDDGEGFIGFYNKNKNKMLITDKSLRKIDYKDYKLNFSSLFTHQRFTTSGHGVDNVHPHETKDFILLHNGVFGALGDNKKSDTSYYVDMLQDLFDEHKDLLVVLKLLGEKITGSYSVVLYNKIDSKMYYYKNSSTSMFYVNSKDYLVMSTKEQNVNIALNYFNIKSDVKSVKSGVLYEINNRGLVKLSKFLVDEPKYFKHSKGNYYPIIDNDLIEKNGLLSDYVAQYNNDNITENFFRDYDDMMDR